MKTEELLRYEAEYRAMQEAFGTLLLVFDFRKLPGGPKTIGAVKLSEAWPEPPLPQSTVISDPHLPQLNASPHPKQ